MVAKVISGKDIKGALNYNEQKVMQGKAQLIHANGFLKEPALLSFYDKLNRFTALNEQNQRSRTNTLHISLNFDASEKLQTDKLSLIASTYMDKIGFADQPYLVYEHNDASHPHVHIVTTIIQPGGKRIPIHYLGKNQSESARKEIEQEFSLMKASRKQREQQDVLRSADVKKIVYGKAETRRSISTVVRAVTRSYRYTSLPELNAALHHFNVIADRGRETSRMFQRKGLIYGLLDEKGKRIGIPLKASAIVGKPTLAFLEKQFALNQVLRKPFKEVLKKSIDTAIRSARSQREFSSSLAASGVSVVFRSNAEGRTYGITFVDHVNKTVFNGSDLGKDYSAAPILKRLGTNPDSGALSETIKAYDIRPASTPASASLIGELITSDSINSGSPETALRLGKKRRKRKQRKL